MGSFPDGISDIDRAWKQRPIRLSFALYNRQDFFLTPEQLTDSVGKDDAINSAVVAGQLGDLSITGLQEPVLTIFRPREVSVSTLHCSQILLAPDTETPRFVGAEYN